LDLSKVLLSARKLENAEATLTEEDNKLVEAYNALTTEKKAEVKKAVEKALGENYELNGTDLKLKEGKTDEKPADFVKASVGAVEQAVNDAKAEKPEEEPDKNPSEEDPDKKPEEDPDKNPSEEDPDKNPSEEDPDKNPSEEDPDKNPSEEDP